MQTSTTGSEVKPDRRLRVVVVDDDRGCVEGLADAIQDFGAQAWACVNGADAMAVIRQRQPDVVFLDLDMPGIGGLAIADLMRTDKALNAIKLIALSGHNDGEARRQTAKAGFDLHLAKPIKLAFLEDMLDLVSATLSVSLPPRAVA